MGMCGVCAGVHGCKGISGHQWVCVGCLQVCAGERGCVRLCAGMRGCVWVCPGVHRCAWICMGVPMCVG